MNQKQRQIEWIDPAASLEKAGSMTGLEYMLAMGTGEIPMAPVAELMGMRGVSAREGEVVCAFTPDESMVNPLGIVHGGPICTVLDSVLGSAVHTTLPSGVGYTSIDINVSYMRPPMLGVELTATGRVIKPGRRVAFVEAEITDPDGKVVATATSSCLIIGG